MRGDKQIRGKKPAKKYRRKTNSSRTIQTKPQTSSLLPSQHSQPSQTILPTLSLSRSLSTTSHSTTPPQSASRPPTFPPNSHATIPNPTSTSKNPTISPQPDVLRDFKHAMDSAEVEGDKFRGIHHLDDSKTPPLTQGQMKYYDSLAQVPKYRRFLPQSDELAPDTVRLSSQSDFNLDFDLELKWQKVQQQGEFKEGSFLHRHQQREYEDVFNEMVSAKTKEFEQERVHLEAVKQKKQQVKSQRVKDFILQQLSQSKMASNDSNHQQNGNVNMTTNDTPMNDDDLMNLFGGLETISIPSSQSQSPHTPSQSKSTQQIVHDPTLLERRMKEIDDFAGKQGLYKTQRPLMNVSDLSQIASGGVEIDGITIDTDNIVQQSLQRMIDSDYRFDNTIGGGKNNNDVDEYDVLASYYGYSDILQEMFESDIITPSTSIIRRVEYAEDPEYEQKSEQLIKDIISEHKLPLQDVSTKRVAQELQHAKRNLVHKGVALVFNEYGEIDFKHITPSKQQVLLAQKHQTLPPIGPKSDGDPDDSFPTIIAGTEPGKKQPTTTPSKSGKKSIQDLPPSKPSAAASKLQHVLSQIGDFTAYHQDSTTKYPTEAEIREIISQQDQLIETGRNDRFDNFEDEPALVDLKQRLFRDRNTQLKAKWDYEDDMKKKASDFKQSDLLFQNNQTLTADGHTPLLRSFQSFQAPKANKANSPYESLKLSGLDAIAAANEQMKIDNSLGYEEYLDDDGIIQRIPRGTLDSQGKPQVRDIPLHKRLKYHANDDELYTSVIEDDNENSPYPLSLNHQEDGRSPFMKQFEVDKPYFMREMEDQDDDEESKIQDIMGDSISKRSKGDRQQFRAIEEEMNDPAHVEKFLLNTLTSAYQTNDNGHENDGQFVYSLKNKKKVLGTKLPEGDDLEAEFQKMRKAAMKRGVPFTHAQLEDAVRKFYSNPTADPNSIEHVELTQERRLAEMDFINSSHSRLLDEDILDIAVDPGTGRDPLVFQTDGGDSMFAKSREYLNDQARIDEIQSRREQAMKQRRMKSDLDSRFQNDQDTEAQNLKENKKIKETLHEEDQKYYDEATGDLFISRPAKPDLNKVYNYVDADHLEDIESLDTMSHDFVGSLFDKGASKGGIGWGKDSKDGDAGQEDVPERLKTLSQSSPEQGLGKDSVQMHPIDYMTKFMFRIHPDMFPAEKYRIIDDRLTQHINANKYRRNKSDLAAQQGTSTTNLPASSVEYETGTFTNPLNIRYYEADNAFLQHHNTKVLSDLNTLLDFYKKLTALDDREKADPFLPHLSQGNIPPTQQFVFFLRSAKGTKINKPKNVKLTNTIWDDEGNEIRPGKKRNKSSKSKSNDELNDDDLLSMLAGQTGDVDTVNQEDNDELDEKTKKQLAELGKELEDDDPEGELPHIRAVRVWFNPPHIGPGTEPRDQTTAWILALERSMVEILSGIEEEVPLSIRERWRTDLDNALVSKAWVRVHQKKETAIDKVFQVDVTDQVAPNEQQLTDMWTKSNLAYFHMFPYANKIREADFRAETHPRHHLFNAMLVGGYIQFDSTLTPKQRIKQLHDFHRLVATSYQHFDCFRWWNRTISENDILEQAQIEQYIQDGNSKKIELTQEQKDAMNFFPYFDEERQNVWPRTHMGESFSLRLAVKFLPENEAPKAQIISSKRILINTHATQSSRQDLLRKLLKIGSDAKQLKVKKMEQDGFSQVGGDLGHQYFEEESMENEKTDKLLTKLAKTNQKRNELLALAKKRNKKVDMASINDIHHDESSSTEADDYENFLEKNDPEAYAKSATSKQLHKSYVDTMSAGVYGMNNRQHLVKHFDKKSKKHTSDVDDETDDQLEENQVDDLIFDYIAELDKEEKDQEQENISVLNEKTRSKTDRDEQYYSPPVNMNDVCVQIRVPINMAPDALQNFVLTHAYILYDEWKKHFTEYHIEHATLEFKQNELQELRLRTGELPSQPLEHIFTVNDVLHFLSSTLASKEQIVTHKNGSTKRFQYRDVVLNKLANQQPMLHNLITFYRNMQDIKYKHIQPGLTPEKQLQKEKTKQDKIHAKIYPAEPEIDTSDVKIKFNQKDFRKQQRIAKSTGLQQLNEEYGARALGVLLGKNNKLDPMINTLHKKELKQQMHQFGINDLPQDTVPSVSGKRSRFLFPTSSSPSSSTLSSSHPPAANNRSPLFQVLDKQLAHQTSRLLSPRKIVLKPQTIRSALISPYTRPVINIKDGVRLFVSPQFVIEGRYEGFSTIQSKQPKTDQQLQEEHQAKIYRLDEIELFEHEFNQREEILLLKMSLKRLSSLRKKCVRKISELSPEELRDSKLEQYYLSVKAKTLTTKNEIEYARQSLFRSSFPEFSILLDQEAETERKSLNQIQHHALKETMQRNQHIWHKSLYNAKVAHTQIAQELSVDPIAFDLPSSKLIPYIRNKLEREAETHSLYQIDLSKPFDAKEALARNFRALAREHSVQDSLASQVTRQIENEEKIFQKMEQYFASGGQKGQNANKGSVNRKDSPFSSLPAGQISRQDIRRGKQEAHAYTQANREQTMVSKMAGGLQAAEDAKLKTKKEAMKSISQTTKDAMEAKNVAQRNLKMAILQGQGSDLPMDVQLAEINRHVNQTVVNYDAMKPSNKGTPASLGYFGNVFGTQNKHSRG